MVNIRVLGKDFHNLYVFDKRPLGKSMGVEN